MSKIDLNNVIVSGNQAGMQKMFDDIYKEMRKEFTEDNIVSLTTFILEMVLKSWQDDVLTTERDYIFDIDDFGKTLKMFVDDYIAETKSLVKVKDTLFKKAKEAVI